MSYKLPNFIGYTTGTFDAVHYGHFEFLKTCKQFYCEKLIVGLVTDELGLKQKRKPVFDFNHRKAILENCKWVDKVVAFNGTSKQTDYEKMKFDILLIADEYCGSSEYSSFSKDYPYIPVVYIPRTMNHSTSDIFMELVKRVIKESSVKSTGISGDLISYNWKHNKNFITKPIKIGVNEVGNTKNNYKLCQPPPRCWKMKSMKNDKIYPFISGINPNRELEIFKLLKHKSWYLGIETVCCFKTEKDKYEVKEMDIERMNNDRKFSTESYWLIQKDGGETLINWIKNKREEEIKDVFSRIEEIINELRSMNIMHMDLHPENILISEKNEVSIIDFGWCMSKTFDMEEDEKKFFDECFEKNFDLLHFKESLEFYNIYKNEI